MTGVRAFDLEMSRRLQLFRPDTKAQVWKLQLTSYFLYRRNRLKWAGSSGSETTIDDRQALRPLRDSPACRNPKANPCATPPPDFSGSPGNAPTSRLATYRGSGSTKYAINTLIGRNSISGLARSSKLKRRIPDWLAEILQERCPGFLETEKALTPKARKARPLALRLEDWIDDHIFGFAKQEGWFSAITYYAIRDPRYQRAEVCWSECVSRSGRKPNRSVILVRRVERHGVAM